MLVAINPRLQLPLLARISLTLNELEDYPERCAFAVAFSWGLMQPMDCTNEQVTELAVNAGMILHSTTMTDGQKRDVFVSTLKVIENNLTEEDDDESEQAFTG